jgi:hypothetical protein
MASITPIQGFSLGADAVYLSKRPLPIAPDGHYDWENQADANTSPQAHAGVTNLINTVAQFSLFHSSLIEPCLS